MVTNNSIKSIKQSILPFYTGIRTKISITQKHFVYFLFLFLISILIVGWYSYYISKKSIIERTFNQLTSVRVEKSKILLSFFADREKEIELIANSSNFFEMTKDVFSSKLFKVEYIEFLQSFLYTNGYYTSIIIINKDNHLLKVDKNSQDYHNLFQNSEKDKFYQDYLKNTKSYREEDIILYDYITENDGNISFFISKPIINKHNYLGLLLFKINISEINKIMQTEGELSGLGKTGESYIVGSDYLLRTSSRFKINSIKKIRVNTEAVKQALSNQSGHKILKDYRNIEVLSSFAPINIKNIKWAIVAEIDKEEALQPVYNLRNSIVILCIIVSIFIFGFVYWGSSKLTNPIISLNEAANKISQGEYNIQLESYSNDEIGELIVSFNKMAKDLFAQSELLKKEKLFRVSSVLDAQENERQRLSRDLHDGLGQMLLAVKIKLEQIQNKGFDHSEKLLSEAIVLLKNSISEIRTISNNLMPNVLANFGLKEGIKRLCFDFESTTNINFDINCEEFNDTKLEPRIQIYIFRIIQELINNIVKHSSADYVIIQIKSTKPYLEIFISDNGIGFDLSKKNSGNGINNIKERTELLGGEIMFESKLSKGTKVILKIPVN